MKTFFFLVFALLQTVLYNHTHQDNQLKPLEILVGSWQVEGKTTYEKWEKKSDVTFEGYSYKLIDNEQKISETLQIVYDNDEIVYKATVPNQNQGKSIHFVLNNNEKDLLSFENLKHDFPKKIQYKKIDDHKLLVNVLGDNNQGFSYYLIKQ